MNVVVSESTVGAAAALLIIIIHQIKGCAVEYPRKLGQSLVHEWQKLESGSNFINTSRAKERSPPQLSCLVNSILMSNLANMKSGSKQ